MATEDASDPQLLEEASRLELQGVAAAEAGDLDKALQSFGRAIELLPERASAYNNRAQALRLKGDVAGKPSGGRPVPASLGAKSLYVRPRARALLGVPCATPAPNDGQP